MTANKPLYTTFSLIRLVKSIVLRTAIVFGLLVIYDELQSGFDEIILIIGLVLLLVFIVLDPNEVIVYKDKLRV